MASSIQRATIFSDGTRRTSLFFLLASAITRAIKEAREGDIVILAGKGHEGYQVLKNKTIDFDDRAVAREVLRGYGYHKTGQS